MIKLFKQSGLLQIIIILMVSVLLWVQAYMNPGAEEAIYGFAPLYDLLFAWAADMPQLGAVLAQILILIEGFWLNVIMTNRKLTSSNTLMPMLIYVVMMSASSSHATMTPIIVANLALLGAVSNMLVSENLTLSFDNIFNSSMLIAFASLIYLPTAVFIVPLIICFFVHSLYRWRHWAMMILGLIAPLIVAATYYFMTDRLYYVVYLWRCDLSDFHIATGTDTLWHTLGNSYSLLLLVIGIGWLMVHAGEHTTMYRTNATVIGMLPIASGLMLLYTQLFPADLRLFAIPATFLLTNYLFEAYDHSRNKRKWIYNIVLLLLIIMSI